MEEHPYRGYTICVTKMRRLEHGIIVPYIEETNMKITEIVPLSSDLPEITTTMNSIGLLTNILKMEYRGYYGNWWKNISVNIGWSQGVVIVGWIIVFLILELIFKSFWFAVLYLLIAIPFCFFWDPTPVEWNFGYYDHRFDFMVYASKLPSEESIFKKIPITIDDDHKRIIFFDISDFDKEVFLENIHFNTLDCTADFWVLKPKPSDRGHLVILDLEHVLKELAVEQDFRIAAITAVKTIKRELQIEEKKLESQQRELEQQTIKSMGQKSEEGEIQ